MGDLALMQFKSRVAGKAAEVKILRSGIEWSTVGRKRVTELLPLTAIESVSTGTAGFIDWKLVVTTADASIEFRTDRSTAEEARGLVVLLVAQLPPPTSNPTPPVGTGSRADELIDLRWLLDNRIIVEADYNEMRARLLGL